MQVMLCFIETIRKKDTTAYLDPERLYFRLSFGAFDGHRLALPFGCKEEKNQ